MSQIAESTVKKILETVSESRKGEGFFKRVELGGRAHFKSHCGMKMVRVKVFYHDGKPCAAHPDLNEYAGADEIVCVCPECLYHYVDVSYD